MSARLIDLMGMFIFSQAVVVFVVLIQASSTLAQIMAAGAMHISRAVVA